MGRMVAIVRVPAWLGAQELLGEQVAARWRRLGAEAGLDVVLAEVGVPAEGDLEVDGRALELGVADLARVAAGAARLAVELESDERVRVVVAERIGAAPGARVDLHAGALVQDVASLGALERRLAASASRRAERAGVRIVGGDVLLGPLVELEPGCTLWAGAVLLGRTRVARGAVVHPGCVLRDTEVGVDAELRACTVAEGAVVGAGVVAGPFAHLRSGTVLEHGSKVGNFVETKNTRLGPGAKANHLTYLGDADVGAGSNIGAGTITCNYDGGRKHRTTVGEGVFVGTNTSLVAPVQVGDGALVAAGSVITADVPPAALAVARAPQRTLEGKGAALLARNRAARRGGGDAG